MGCPEELRPDMSVTDLAYRILKARGKAVHFKELIEEILSIKPMAGENRGKMIAQIHTEINLDARFIHHGNGEWGLRDWQPKGGTKVIRIRQSTAQPSRTRAELMSEEEDRAEGKEYDQDEEEEEEEEDEEEASGYGREEEFESGDDDLSEEEE